MQWSCIFVHLGLNLPDWYICSCLQHVQYCLQLVAALCAKTYFLHLFVARPLHFCSSPTSLVKSKGFHNFLLHLLLSPLVIGAGNLFLPCHLHIISGHRLRTLLCMYWCHDVNVRFVIMKMMYFQHLSNDVMMERPETASACNMHVCVCDVCSALVLNIRLTSP